MIYAQSPLCCHIYFIGVTSQGPLFCRHNKTPLSKTKFVSHVRLGLLRGNLPADKYAGHSFWIGAATTAAAGIEDSTIQTLSCWQSSSYLLHIRLDPRHIASLSSTLAKCSIWAHSWIYGEHHNVYHSYIFSYCIFMLSFVVTPLLIYTYVIG